MRSGLFLVFLLSSAFADSPGPSGQLEIEPIVEKYKGIKIFRVWHELQKSKKLPYDPDACYGWIAEGGWPKIWDYVGMGFTPNCKIITGNLWSFTRKFKDANAAYYRYSHDPYGLRNKCAHTHLFIVRLHRLDELGLFTYHYSRVRMAGNKIEVTFFALKDVMDTESSYHSHDAPYDHPSVRFYNADDFPKSYEPFLVYTMDFEIFVWFWSAEGLRLFNYRVTWDSQNTDNGYHVDVYQEMHIPNAVLPQDRVAYVITSEDQVHYFFVRTNIDNEHDIFVLAHNDLMMQDFSRLEIFDLKMPVDVFPRAIVGNVMPYYSLGHHTSSVRNNHMCSKGVHVELYLKKNMPNVTDPPLTLNIYRTHYRSAFPFVTSGRTIEKPDYFKATTPIILTIVAMLISSWAVLGYGMLPLSIARRIRHKFSGKSHYWFKSLAKRRDTQFGPFFRFLFGVERMVRSLVKRLYKGVLWVALIESKDEEEETRQLLAAISLDQPSTRESTTPNE